MRVWKNELFKIVSNGSFLLLFLLMLGVNAVLIGTSSMSDYYSKEEYKQVQDDMQSLSGNEKISYIEGQYKKLSVFMEIQEGTDTLDALTEKWDLTSEQAEAYLEQYQQGSYAKYTGDLLSEYFLFSDLFEEAKAIQDYPSYLDGIIQKANRSHNISIFNTQDKFSSQNAQVTAEAFRPLLGTQPVYTNSSINTAFHFSATDVILVMVLFFMITFLIVHEKENQQFILLKPTKNGRVTLVAAKLGTLFVLSLLATLILYLSNFLIIGIQCGFPDFSLPIQSIYGFDGCSFQITIWQFLIFYLLSKAALAFLIGLILFFFVLTTKSAAMIYLKTILLFAVSLSLYLFIPDHSVFQILKYINLIYFLRVAPIYQYYFNLNILSLPVNMFAVFLFVTAIAIVVFAAVNVSLFVSKDTVSSTVTKMRFQKRERTKISTSVFYHELYKILIMNKGLLVLVFLALFQCYSFFSSSVYVPSDEYYYQKYMSALEGPVNDQKLETIEKERLRFEELDKTLADANSQYEKNEINYHELQQIDTMIRAQSKGRLAFERVLQRLEYVTQHNQTAQGDEAWMVYETGWEELTGKGIEGYNSDMALAMVLTLVMIAICSSVFSNEYSTGMISVIACYKNGRAKTAKTKIIICMFITVISFILVYLTQLLAVGRAYGLSSLDASISSIPSLSEFPVHLKIWQYLVLLYVVRLIMVMSLLFFIFALSIVIKNAMNTMITLSVLFIIPLALHLLDIHIVSYCTFNVFLSGNLFLDLLCQSSVFLLLIFIPILIGLLSVKKIRKSFRESF